MAVRERSTIVSSLAGDYPVGTVILQKILLL